MSRIHVEEPFGFRLSSRSRLNRNQVNRSIAGMVHGIERREEDLILISILLQHGDGMTMEISHNQSHDWRRKIRVKFGKVILIDGFVDFCLHTITDVTYVHSPLRMTYTLSYSVVRLSSISCIKRRFHI
ncbi:hypothetical protein PRIPAC_83355 [Pristionchus pacificus]|uniref:Uncharacterized protein n=1 Tax=Pristionchus pacificus TaxID=54126 RepID=A0A2A6BK70_PRIPA|nr:hypothetical protein PRIPAC_83355 [Pristionchus pacificus]|eukprot:PDM66315.1 hypothetical protein PRIPAC_47732 [Pristionchus pacificus]